MSHYRHRISEGGKKYIVIILDIVLGALLIGMLYTENNQEKAQEENLRELAQKQREKENEIEKSISMLSQTMSDYMPGIVCWGDSLTAGAGSNGNPYPLVLDNLIQESITKEFNRINSQVLTRAQRLTNIPVINMGVGGENTVTICGRNGSIPFVVSEDMSRPAECQAIQIHIKSSIGIGASPLRQGAAGMDYVIIGGIKGKIEIMQESYTSPEYSYVFTREKPGGSVHIKAGTEIITSGSENYLNYIPIIFIGTNGGYSDYQDLIAQQRGIINHQKGNPKGRFIVVGLHYGKSAEEFEMMEAILKEEYGNQFINLREYLCTNAMKDAGLTPTEKDKKAMANGQTPYSLLSDEVHFNEAGYKVLGELIYKQMEQLGYFSEIKESIEQTISIMK